MTSIRTCSGSTAIADLLPKAPEGVKPTPRAPFEQTQEYRDLLAKRRESSLRKAGLRGNYAHADSPEGQACFERFKQGRGTYLYGAPGRGKTWAAACCVRLAVAQGRKCKLMTAKALLDGIKAEWDGGERGVLRRAERYDLLALDDLGMERSTPWAMETLSGLIDARVSEGLPTVITSNYSLGELRERWGGMEGARVVSRIGGACERIELKGVDRRLA